MQPFNIRINSGEKDRTLTILPYGEEGSYKVIYNGAILGGVIGNGEKWNKIPDEEFIGGDLPMYSIKFGAECTEVRLDEPTLSRIGKQISAELATRPSRAL